MGAIDEISGDGKGALLAGDHSNSDQQRHRARLKLADIAQRTGVPNDALLYVINELGLMPDPPQKH